MGNKEVIEFPEKSEFSTYIPIRKIDLSMDLHVSFASILDLVFEAHLQFFDYLGYKVTDIHGRSIIFSNLGIMYQGELFYNDKVKVEVAIDNMQSKFMDLYFRLTKDDQIPVSTVKIRVLFFDYTSRKVVEIPEQFRKRFPHSQAVQTQSVEAKSPSNSKWENLEMRKMSQDFATKLYKFAEKIPDKDGKNIKIKLRSQAIQLISTLTHSYHNKLSSEKFKAIFRFEANLREIEEILIFTKNLGFGGEHPPLEEVWKLISLVTEFRNQIFSGKKYKIQKGQK
ncbi:MAG: thioesterase family protein [Leptospira sp.]|nr:thioesterase family protein [Leptospira sp.]